MRTVLITGAAGFIGSYVVKALANEKLSIIGIDNLNGYYSEKLKKDRLAELSQQSNFIFKEVDVSDSRNLNLVFETFKPDVVINLAAQAGVRYSIENPQAYMDSNMQGFLNILEACRKHPVEHLIYASSSSVYGGNKVAPFSTNHNVDHPVSLYAALWPILIAIFMGFQQQDYDSLLFTVLGVVRTWLTSHLRKTLSKGIRLKYLITGKWNVISLISMTSSKVLLN